MADADDDVREEVRHIRREASEVLALAPAEIPGRCLELLGRQLKLIEAAQARLARGFSQRRDKDGNSLPAELTATDAARALGSLASSSKMLLELHQLFEPRANAAQGEHRAGTKALAGAAAQKLLAALDAEEAEEVEPGEIAAKASNLTKGGHSRLRATLEAEIAPARPGRSQRPN